MHVDAPARTVAAALAEPRLLRRAGLPVRAEVPQLATGGELRIGPVRMAVTRADERGLRLAGPWVELVADVEPAGAGARLAVRSTPRLRAVTAWAAAVRDRAGRLAAAPVVVGAVIVRDGTVLAAQRDRPAATAGRWEFPGGKVEPGESEQAALVRECVEELGAEVLVGERVGPDLVLPSGWLLRLRLATLAPGALPVAGEHRALRWVPGECLADLDWLPADRIVLPGLADLLSPGRPAAGPRRGGGGRGLWPWPRPAP